MSALEARARVVSAFLARAALGVMSRDPALGLALALASTDLADALDVPTTVTPAHTLGEFPSQVGTPLPAGGPHDHHAPPPWPLLADRL